MIEEVGLEKLSLSKLAAQFDVKAPSLYKHVNNKAAIIEAVNHATYRELSETILNQTVRVTDPVERLLIFSRAYRQFAHANPVTYQLALGAEVRGDEEALAAIGKQMEHMLRPLVGEADSLTALRGLWALIHGFVMLEINHQMRRGGDLDATFEIVVKSFIRGWQTPRR
ncbi:MAG: WHG domain-containing protein [Chloroflexi bacterium]|nr:WHG domain-containing protein [Chloroflexota bacterium]